MRLLFLSKMKLEYTSLEVTGPVTSRPWAYPKLSRLRVIAVISILVIAIVLFLYKYLSLEVLTYKQSYQVDSRFARIRYKHTKRRLPQCIIVGARKAGTRALLTFLNLHPEIQTAKNEVHFFDDDNNYSQGMEWYRKKMPYSFPGQITIEKTPSYLVVDHVPERVYSMNQTIKLLLIVRDPIDRAISDYLQIHLRKVAKNKPDRSFEEYAIDEVTGKVDRSWRAIRRSIYHRHLQNWLRLFPLQQFHVVSGENLVNEPVRELREVERFLGLEHRITRDLFYFNDSRGFYCINNNTKQCLNDSKGRRHPSVNHTVILKLREFFKPLNKKFYRQVKRDFHWD